jgi:protein-S-isoprenylcysteine O-methyltransferase Ste14
MLMLRGLIGGVFQLALFSGFLLVPAGLVPGGTWYWERALIFVGVYGVILEACIVALAVVAPASLEARLKPPTSKKQPTADRFVTAILLLTMFSWFVAIPIDVFHWRLLPPPGLVVSLFGVALTVVGYAVILAAIYKNSFAVPIVEDQSESGQVVIDTGPYAHVRHPLYSGIPPFFAGVGLWLQSYASLIAVAAILAILIARIAVEEKTLRTTLPGYQEYMEKVRYRLIPFIW